MTSRGFFRGVAATAVAAALGFAAPAGASNIVEEWSRIQAPRPPELKKVSVSPKDTALFLMDLQDTSCVPDRRPRCAVQVPQIKALLEQARAKGMPVVHAHTSSAKPENILKDVAPAKGEPIVSSSVDKFYNTDLEKILKDKGVKTVILIGTSAEGTVVGSAVGGSIRGFQIVVPVDGMSSNEPFAEQYVAWHLANSPGTRRTTTLTTIGMIEIK